MLSSFMDSALNEFFAREKAYYFGKIKSAFPRFSFHNPVVIFGAGYIGDAYVRLLNENQIGIRAISDNDPGKWGKKISGIPVVPPETLKRLPSDMQFIIAIMHYHAVQKQLQDMGFSKIWPHMYFPTFYPEKFSNHYFHSGIAIILKNREKIREVFSFLADDFSGQTYLNIIKHHLTLDRKYLQGYVSDIKKEYYRDVFSLTGNEVFIDGGAYDGDTVLKFLDAVRGKYTAVFAFEPDKNVFRQLKENLGRLRLHDLHPENCGLGRKRALLSFESEGTISGRISEKGNSTIRVVPLDDYIDYRPTFIKMDIEGAEPEALLGSKKILAKYKPKLAICLYHRPEHLWEIPLLIKKLNNKYKLFIRHYSETVHETVCYAY